MDAPNVQQPLSDTIVARCTPPGRSLRAMIRLSGPATPEICARTLGDELEPRQATATSLKLGAASLPILAVRYQAPASYTGEDALEIQLPANPLLLERVLSDFIAQGARPAEPGEFSARAYLNAKLTLAQAEGVGAMIAARTESQLKAARQLLAGQAGAAFADWADRTAHLLALVEAGIDFTDQEDVVAVPPATLAASLDEISNEITSQLARSTGTTPRTQPLVAIVGKPNAGKSSLFNAMLGHTRAVASDQQGTTRDAIIEPLNLSAQGGPEILLADLPGLDALSDSPADAAAQRAANETIASADLIIHCDPHARFDELAIPDDRPTIRVRTKADLPGPTTGLGVCALDGWNLAALNAAITDALDSVHETESDLIPRHRRVLESALANLRSARDLVGATPYCPTALAYPELIAGELRLSLDSLGELCGRITPDDVIGRVFTSFCVGK